MDAEPTAPAHPMTDAADAALPSGPTAAPGAPAGFEPWGPWPTLGLGIAILVVWIVTQAVVMVLGILGVAVAGVPAPSEPSALGLPHAGFVFALATIVSAPVGIGLAALFARMRGPARRYLALERPTLRQAVLWTLGLGALLVSYELLSRVFDRPPVPESMLEIYRTALVQPVLWLAVVVAAPIFEETLFRGFMIPGLARARWLGPAGAAIVSALVFTALHLVQYDLFDLGYVLMLGVFFGAARLATGSLPLAIGLHLLTNLIATVQMEWVLRGG